MPVTNLSNVTFSAAEAKTMSEALLAIKKIMQGKATNLTEDEKKLYGSINEDNKLVVEKVFKYMGSNEEIVPKYTDVEEMNRDNTSRKQLDGWLKDLNVLHDYVQSTKILLDYDVFQASLSIYRNVRYLAGENVAGMTEIYNDLRQFFPGGRTATPETPAADTKS